MPSAHSASTVPHGLLDHAVVGARRHEDIEDLSASAHRLVEDLRSLHDERPLVMARRPSLEQAP